MLDEIATRYFPFASILALQLVKSAITRPQPISRIVPHSGIIGGTSWLLKGDGRIFRAQGAGDELENINQRLEKILRQAGGASRVLVNMVLLLLLFSLVMFIYTTIKESMPLVR